MTKERINRRPRAKDVECESCGALPGEVCKTRSGIRARKYHFPRRQLYYKTLCRHKHDAKE